MSRKPGVNYAKHTEWCSYERKWETPKCLLASLSEWWNIVLSHGDQIYVDGVVSGDRWLLLMFIAYYMYSLEMKTKHNYTWCISYIGLYDSKTNVVHNRQIYCAYDELRRSPF